MSLRQSLSFRRALHGISCGAIAFVTAAPAGAQVFPTKTVTVLNYSAPGSAGEQMMRGISQEAGKILGKPVIVEARPGGGGSRI